ncbi:MAG TPA: hypothetical protein VL284_05845 [Thermoanaerobaculia bacterium]|nr:hypothetical protein [Thermoanaerobaculia bacterium]
MAALAAGGDDESNGALFAQGAEEGGEEQLVAGVRAVQRMREPGTSLSVNVIRS